MNKNIYRYIFLLGIFLTSFKLQAQNENKLPNEIVKIEKNNKISFFCSVNLLLQQIRAFTISHKFFTVRCLISLWVCLFNFIAKKMAKKDLKYLMPLWRIAKIPILSGLTENDWEQYYDFNARWVIYWANSSRIFAVEMLIKSVFLGCSWKNKDWQNIPLEDALETGVLWPLLECVFFTAIDTAFLTNTYNFLEKHIREHWSTLFDMHDIKITKFDDLRWLFESNKEKLISKLIQQKRFKFLQYLLDQEIVTIENYYRYHAKKLLLPGFLKNLDSIDSCEDTQNLIFSLIEKKFLDFNNEFSRECYYLDVFLKMARRIPSKRKEVLNACFQSIGNNFLERRLQQGDIFLFYDMGQMNEKTISECYETWEYFFDEYIVNTLDKNSFEYNNNLLHIFFNSLNNERSGLMIGIDGSVDSLMLDICKKTATRLVEYYKTKNYDWQREKNSKNETALQHLLYMALNRAEYKQLSSFFIKLFDFLTTDKNTADDAGGKTFFHYACIKAENCDHDGCFKNGKRNCKDVESYIEIFKQLFDLGCEINVLDKNGCYPLDYIDFKNYTLKNFLISQGATSKGYSLLFGLDQFSNNPLDFQKQLLKLLIDHADESPWLEYKDRIVNMYPDVCSKKENNDLIIKCFMQYHLEAHGTNQEFEKTEKELHIVNKYLIFFNPYSSYYGNLSHMYGDWLLHIVKQGTESIHTKEGVENIHNENRSNYIGRIFTWFIENEYTCDFERIDEYGANVFHVIAKSGLYWHFKNIITLPNYDPKKTYAALTACYNKQKLEDRNFPEDQHSTPLYILDDQIKKSLICEDHKKLKNFMEEKINELSQLNT